MITGEGDNSYSSRDLRLFGYDTFTPGLGNRYGSKEMKRNWSPRQQWHNVRQIWLAGAEVQHDLGLVSADQLADLRANIGQLSVARILELEREKGHDVAGAISEFSEVAPLAGQIVHRSMTSEDGLSNAEIMQILDAFGIIRPKLVGTLDAFGSFIDRYKGLTCTGYTHLQAAEPTTMGYRFAKYASNLLTNLHQLDHGMPNIKGKGMKGAVGTSASFMDMLNGTDLSASEYERQVMQKLGIPYVTVSDQTYPRPILLTTVGLLSNIGASLHNWALDFQLLQSSFVDEVSEPRRKGQVGSSAMPHKQNPIQTENICSLTEFLPGISSTAWTTAAFVTFERTLRDSGGKRDWLPQAFFIVDESLSRAERVMRGMKVHEASVATNLAKYAPYFATEVLLGRLVGTGMDRKLAHEILVEHSETAVDAVRSGQKNPLEEIILGDPRIIGLLGPDLVRQSFQDVYHHTGRAEQACQDFLDNQLYPAIRAAA